MLSDGTQYTTIQNTLTVHLGHPQNFLFGLEFVCDVNNLIAPFPQRHLGTTPALEEADRDILQTKITYNVATVQEYIKYQKRLQNRVKC